MRCKLPKEARRKGFRRRKFRREEFRRTELFLETNNMWLCKKRQVFRHPY